MALSVLHDKVQISSVEGVGDDGCFLQMLHQAWRQAVSVGAKRKTGVVKQEKVKHACSNVLGSLKDITNDTSNNELCSP